ncbi:MAG: excinuclease ATPase subunit [Betaproteobacteria bacterium]|nr:excinuclease ATPase subunit [Betaproteobacteria bacterium]
MKIPVKFAGFVPLFVSLSFCALNAQARDAKYFLPIWEVVKTARASGQIGDDIRFYFGRQGHPHIREMLTRGVVTNKKTNRTNKSDRGACEWVMLSALIQLQERARREGGNAVINIKSYYKKQTFSSESQYECHAGTFSAGVALKGDVVRLER